MMIPGLRSPRKHQIHLHLEGKQKTDISQHHRLPLHGRRRRSQERPSNRETPMRGSLWPRHPAHPATHTAPLLRVPIVGTRRSFPSPTMTPFLSEKKLTTSGAGLASAHPVSERAAASEARQAAAGPTRRGRYSRPVPRRGTTSVADPTAGREDRGPGGEGREAAQPPRSPGPYRGPAES